MSPPKYNQPDQRHTVSRLAAEFKLSVDEVTALYECECATLAIGAHVTKFLHIFAIRHVQETLQKRRLESVGFLTVSLALVPPITTVLPLTIIPTTRSPTSHMLSHAAIVGAPSIVDQLFAP